MKKKFTFIFILVLILMCFSVFLKTSAAVQQVDLIYANPAEDSSTAMRFNWHSKSQTCILQYTVSTDEAFTYANSVTVIGKPNEAKYTSSESFYVYKTELTGLTPDTTYLYRIKSGQTTSDVYKFKTAGFSGSFNFMNFGDVHTDASEGAKITNLDKLINIAETNTAEIGGLDLLISTGDDVKYGNRYTDWQEYNRLVAKHNYMIAPINGNHEQKTSAGQSPEHSWFLNTWNKPENGVSAEEGSYWFLYNNVLFIAIDDQRGTDTAASVKWVEEVFRKNEGRYQYSIVYKHNPWYKAGQTTYCDYGGYDFYYKVFDKYNLDLALSGDDHVYVHTKPIYNNAVSTDPSKGTVFITVPNIPVSTSAMAVNKTPANSSYVMEGTGGEIGALYFTVTPEKLCGYTYTWGGRMLDSFEIPAKREFTARADLKDKVEENLQYVQLKGVSEGTVYGDSSMTSIVKEISFLNGEANVGTFYPSKDKNVAFNITGLPVNKLVPLTAKITYVDDTKKDVEILANTFDYFGRISNLRVAIDGDNVTIGWHSELVGDNVAKIKVYRNDTEVGEVNKNVELYQFAKTSDDDGARYKIALIASDGSTIGEYKCSYSAIGDLNYDGKVDGADCDVVSSFVFGSTLTNDQKTFADINKDGKIDYQDITYLWLNYKKGTSLRSDTVTVTYRALDGSYISSQVIRAGTNANEPVAPTIEGYTFIGWTASPEAIGDNITIYPIYSK